MNPHFERGQLLFQQGRYAMAEEALRRSLAEQPDHAWSHALLAICLLQQQKLPEATEEAGLAIAVAPELPFAHYAMASVLVARNRMDEAEQAAKQGVQLDPYDPDLHQMLGAIYMAQRRWPSALEEADAGLRLDAEHLGCANLKAQALVQLGRKDEADLVMEGVLARDPEDAYSHANQGWTTLHQNEPNKALEHFREALRLEPNNDYARAGLVEALKARYWIYRQMLRWFLFMSRLSQGGQWMVIIGLIVGYNVLRSIAANNANLRPFVLPIMAIMVAFAVMTWVAVPLFNLMLRLNKYGRHALSRTQITQSNWIGLFLLGAIISLAYGLIANHSTGILLAFCLGFMVLVISGVFAAPWGWPRFVMAGIAVGLFGVGLYGVYLDDSTIGMLKRDAKPIEEQAGQLFTAFFVGCFLFSLVANAMVFVRVKK